MSYTAAQQQFVDRTNDFVTKLPNSSDWSMTFQAAESDREYKLYSPPLIVDLDAGPVDQDAVIDFGPITGSWPETFTIPSGPVV